MYDNDLNKLYQDKKRQREKESMEKYKDFIF